MPNFALAGFLVNLSYLLLTLGALRLVIWYLNKSVGISFSEVLRNQITFHPLAASVYYSARWIGLCVVAAAFLR